VLGQSRTCDCNSTQSCFHLFSHFSGIQSDGISTLPSSEVENVSFPLSVKTDIFHFLLEAAVWRCTVCNTGLLLFFSRDS